ncbi:hypothetical protein [Nocardioides sp. P5_E3]
MRKTKHQLGNALICRDPLELIAADPDIRLLVPSGWKDLTSQAPAAYLLVDYLLVSAGPASLGVSQTLADRGHQH